MAHELRNAARWAEHHAPVDDPVQRQVLIIIAGCGDFDGHDCRITTLEVAAIAGISADATDAAISHLEERGVLSRHEPEGGSWRILTPVDYLGGSPIVRERHPQSGLNLVISDQGSVHQGWPTRRA